LPEDDGVISRLILFASWLVSFISRCAPDHFVIPTGQQTAGMNQPVIAASTALAAQPITASGAPTKIAGLGEALSICEEAISLVV
jgi:hypothetical protein